jgi:hypothetical protein
MRVFPLLQEGNVPVDDVSFSYAEAKGAKPVFAIPAIKPPFSGKDFALAVEGVPVGF